MVKQNIHYNLGMVRMSGTYPAEKCLGILKTYFAGQDFEMSIACAVTDGASIMKNKGRLSTLDHQLCYAHALQLAVCNVLYSPIIVSDMAEEKIDYNDNDDENIYNDSFDVNQVDVNQV